MEIKTCNLKCALSLVNGFLVTITFIIWLHYYLNYGPIFGPIGVTSCIVTDVSIIDKGNGEVNLFTARWTVSYTIDLKFYDSRIVSNNYDSRFQAQQELNKHPINTSDTCYFKYYNKKYVDWDPDVYQITSVRIMMIVLLVSTTTFLILDIWIRYRNRQHQHENINDPHP